MYKKSSKRTGGSSVDGWSTNRPRRGAGPVIQRAGRTAFLMPAPHPADSPPTDRQLRFAKVISVRLNVAVPEPCLSSRPCMKAFLDHFAPQMPARSK